MLYPCELTTNNSKMEKKNCLFYYGSGNSVANYVFLFMVIV
jgi:hypothetical protein